VHPLKKIDKKIISNKYLFIAVVTTLINMGGPVKGLGVEVD